ncbi:hypothetical protein PLICRDRAFT_41270 [Plicaturopsis crispa FD-325 SS-3]|nr:hypothetical protein PLICRDRAFT_41270 [Plicaturopsis crispa FD-325 SS-3]
MALSSVGTRIALSGYLGTIRFVGNVDGTNGVWLGVEWDDPKRGKHDGVKDGKRYFSCRYSNNSGSFIRPSASIVYGRSFLQALTAKYVEAPRGAVSQERVLLGSSNGAIEVEAPGLDKIRGKFSNLRRLREVSLDDDEYVATSDPPGEIRNTCPSVRGLDLSTSLLPSWDMVALIAVELPALERLALNRTRLLPFSDPLSSSRAFLKLSDLQLSDTRVTWEEILPIIGAMPSLKTVELGYNSMRRLARDPGPSTPSKEPASLTVEEFNFDANELDDWEHVATTLWTFPSLNRLILTANPLKSISPPQVKSDSPLKSLQNLSLSFTALRAWSDIDALAMWCPALQTLSINGTALAEDTYARQFAVARIPTLRTLDAASISARDRTDCELFYMSWIVKHGPADDDARSELHPRWRDLCTLHGTPDESSAVGKRHHQDKLSNHLIQLNIYRCTSRPSRDSSAPAAPPSQLRVLPTMLLRTFRLKILKTLKPRPSVRQLELWLRMRDGDFALMNVEDDAHDLEWWGLEEGSEVYIFLDTSIS